MKSGDRSNELGMVMEVSHNTPLMKQYWEIKSKYPDCILLFRVGDFYEAFDEDARKMSGVLGIALTKRNTGTAMNVDMSGFPYHARDIYVPRLVNAGFKVAICEQLEEPSPSKKIVKRDVVEVITPGLSPAEVLPDIKKNNFIASIKNSGEVWGITLTDITTGEFYISEGDINVINRIISSFQPQEVLLPHSYQQNPKIDLDRNVLVTYLPDEYFSPGLGEEKICQAFRTSTVKGFGISQYREGLASAGALLLYIEEKMYSNIVFRSISRLDASNYVWLDAFTLRNLEIIKPMFPEGKSLKDILDECRTPMGSRLLTRRLTFPLRDISQIQQSLDATQFFYDNWEFNNWVRDTLRKISDIERISSRISLMRATPRELLALAHSLKTISHIVSEIKKLANNENLRFLTDIPDVTPVADKILKYIVENPSSQVGTGNVINPEVSPSLKEYLTFLNQSKEILAQIHKKEVVATGIPSLKIGYNQVFGYYLEVPNTHKNKVPPSWIRKQTLTSAERYVTPELKEVEEKIVNAEEKIKEIETQIYNELIEEVRHHVPSFLDVADKVAHIDLFSTFADISRKRKYVRPHITTQKTIKIIDGRHPVIEMTLPPNKPYIPNGLHLNDNEENIIILTGPNMAGKSAYLRQNALIVIMAQVGCFVPATYAQIGICDRIFSRVGASDNIAMGESTFMVEMIETAIILNNLSERSLILLDEIGRGTSTYDGMSIAQSIIEYLHNHKYRPFVIFATHYHELARLEQTLPRLRNYHVKVKEEEDRLLFLHVVERGSTKSSFGIEVARMAGLPQKVIERAYAILKSIDTDKHNNLTVPLLPFDDDSGVPTYTIPPLIKKILSIIEKMDIDTTTPVEALLTLKKIKDILEKDNTLKVH